MIQCFVKKKIVPNFSGNTIPQLNYICKIDADYKHPRIMHSHEDIVELLFVRSGTGVYIIDEMRYPIKKGDMIICNNGVLHDEAPECNSELNTYCCAISNLQLEGLKKNCLISDHASPIVSCYEQFDDIEAIMGMLYSHLVSREDGVEETCHYLMLSLLTKLLRSIKEHKSYPEQKDDEIYRKGKAIKHYIDSRYDEKLSLESVGRALHISPYYLAHVFKKTIGYSPLQYITRRRIGEAQTLLISTDYSITQIASLVGYDNISHFNIMFLKYIGKNPREYRNTYIGSMSI